MDSVRVDRQVNRHHNRTVPLGLGDQHAVKPVAMWTRQLAGTSGVRDTDRQPLKSLTGNMGRDVKCRDCSLRQSPEPVFGSDFPTPMPR